MHCCSIVIKGEPHTNVCNLTLAGDALVFLRRQALVPVLFAVADKVLGTATLTPSFSDPFIRLNLKEEADSTALTL